MSVRRAIAVLAVPAALACSGQAALDGLTGTTRSPIVNGSPATAFPEAVVVTSSGFIPCSGVVLAPRVVLTAGHCRSSTKKYLVSAPNADQQSATGSSDWTTFDGAAATSSDTLLVFLDSDLTLDTYPTIPEGEVAAGTDVVDVGRTLNNVITDATYVSSTVTLQGAGDALGFHYNYEALPDLSQDGDSGGPIELVKGAAHTVVAVVDTDTVEQDIAETTPIDLFARLDLVRADILAQIAAHASRDGGSTSDAPLPKRDAGETLRDGGEVTDARTPLRDGGRDDGGDETTSKAGGCDVTGAPGQGAEWLFGPGLMALASRRRRA
jgi:hypothetical protein